MQKHLTLLDAIPIESISASQNQTGLDIRPYINTNGENMLAYINIDNVSGTTPTCDVKVQESDDDATYTDITGATFTQVTTTAATEVIFFQTNKRYVRFVVTLGGTSPVYLVSGAILVEKRMV